MKDVDGNVLHNYIVTAGVIIEIYSQSSHLLISHVINISRKLKFLI